MLLAGETLKAFSKCASGWGNSKKIKMLKNGGSYVCVSMPCAQTWFPPSLTFLPLLEYPQSEAHFRKQKKKLSPARSTFHFLFLTFPQPACLESHSGDLGPEESMTPHQGNRPQERISRQDTRIMLGPQRFCSIP